MSAQRPKKPSSLGDRVQRVVQQAVKEGTAGAAIGAASGGCVLGIPLAKAGFVSGAFGGGVVQTYKEVKGAITGDDS